MSRFTEAGLSFGHGSSNAYDEAAYLILHTLHLPLDLLEPFLDARLSAAEIDAVLNVIERRATQRVPAAYITQEAWMHGFRFHVDERVIVPRSFIGELLQDGLQPYVADPDQVTRRNTQSVQSPHHITDIGPFAQYRQPASFFCHLERRPGHYLSCAGFA